MFWKFQSILDKMFLFFLPKIFLMWRTYSKKIALFPFFIYYFANNRFNKDVFLFFLTSIPKKPERAQTSGIFLSAQSERLKLTLLWKISQRINIPLLFKFWGLKFFSRQLPAFFLANRLIINKKVNKTVIYKKKKKFLFYIFKN